MDLLDVVEGDTVELDNVLLVGDDDNVTVGTPTVEGARVMATSQGDGRGKKIIVFRYKSKVRYRRKTGHRQGYTRLTIDEIIGPGAAPKVPARRRTRAKNEVSEDGA